MAHRKLGKKEKRRHSKSCQHCGKSFKTSKTHTKYCGSPCRFYGYAKTKRDMTNKLISDVKKYFSSFGLGRAIMEKKILKQLRHF